MIFYGTIVNVAAITVGSVLGMVLGSGMSKKYSLAVFQAIGLFVVFLGVSMTLKADSLMVVVLSLVAGGVLGTRLQLDERVERWSNWLKGRFRSNSDHFSEGLISASLLFCMGSMAIVGSIDEGLGRGSQLLLTKSVMDGFASVALASAWGRGVLWSAVPVLLYQGGITLLALLSGHYFSETMVADVSATGGILLLGLGLAILEVVAIPVIRYLPALLFALLLSWLVQQGFFFNL